MNVGHRRMLLYTFKALSDENRFHLFSLLCQDEHNVGTLAEHLSVSESTVSHHLSKLREMGLVSLRADGTQRIYRVNDSGLARFKEIVAKIEQVPITDGLEESDNSWIDALPIRESDRKVLRNYTHQGRLKQLPSQQKKLLIILNWLASEFESGVQYKESEVNAILKQYHEDFAGLRRDLVDFGYLRRERGGGKYWLAPEEEPAG